MKKLTLILVGFFALVSCKTVSIENGEVPYEYLGQAKKFEGVYSGSFEGVRGDLKVSFEGNKPVLTMKNVNGEDLFKPSCHSKINNLKWVSIDNDKNVDAVAFYFDPGLCFIDGREVVLSFANDYQKIHVSVLEHRYTERRCRWEVSDPRVGPREVCEYVDRDVTSRGTFKR